MAVTSLLLCSTVTFFSITFSWRPHGDCMVCCRINEREDISFLLYTRSNPEHPQRLYVDGDHELESSNLDKNKTTVFYIVATYIQHTDYNVIIVDWSPLAAAPWYDQAANNAKITGQYVARFIRYLHSRKVYIDTMHVIGFSLGAEAAGFTGKIVTSPKLPRITGLDPAFPLYNYRPRLSHLTASDARFVDVIHTDGGVFGFLRPIGHADFYPNGGIPVQPGCKFDELLDTNRITSFAACSHNRAWEYYAESVEDPNAFPADRCTNYEEFKMGLCAGNDTVHMKTPEVPQPEEAYLGIKADRSLRGSFFLQTNTEPPYGLHRPLKVKPRENS